MNNEIFAVALLFVGLLNLVISIVIGFSNIRNRINIYFATFTLGIALWAIGLSGFISSTDLSVAENWARLYYFAPIMICTSLLIFSLSFPVKSKRIRWVEALTYLLGTLITILTLFDRNFIILRVENREWGKEVILGLGGYIYYSIFFLSFYTGGLVNLYSSIKKVGEATAIQLRLLLYSLAAAGGFGVLFNLILPFLGNYRLIWIGPQFTIIIVVMLAITIAKYGLFDLRILIGQIIYYLYVSIFFFLFFLITMILVTGGANLSGLEVTIAFYISVGSGILFDVMLRIVKERIESRIINPGFSSNEELAKYNKQIASLLSFPQVIEITLSVIGRTLRPYYKGLIIFVDNDHIVFDESGSKNIIKENPSLQSINTLKYLLQNVPGSYFQIDEIEVSTPSHLISNPTIITELYTEMKKHNLRMVHKITDLNNRLLGVLFLSSKDLDTAYYKSETSFLSEVLNSLGLSISRTLLYNEVEAFNKTLQAKVESATHEIAEKNHRLEETLKFERDMLDVLGHELRTPLGTVRNALGVFDLKFKAKTITNEDVLKFVDTATENIKREIQLLEAILASAKIDNQKLSLDFSQVDANDVVHDSFESYKYDAQNKGLELKIEVPPTPLVAYADRLRIQQVMDNLTSNAVKYTLKGSVTIRLEDIGDKLKFSVQDTGEGIAQEDIPKLGQKFFRINPYLNSDGKIGDRKIVRPGGTGIGLYVVFQLIKYMFGEINVSSKLGVGSTFSFTVKKYYPGIENVLKVVN